ncbi:hypothetical protein B7494_g7797 [Chlorociboria aeruginascens]|nr:hypothetical protein B7494_g7797 [Chlorociboria aeruginascens]
MLLPDELQLKIWRVASPRPRLIWQKRGARKAPAFPQVCYKNRHEFSHRWQRVPVADGPGIFFVDCAVDFIHPDDIRHQFKTMSRTNQYSDSEVKVKKVAFNLDLEAHGRIRLSKTWLFCLLCRQSSSEFLTDQDLEQKLDHRGSIRRGLVHLERYFFQYAPKNDHEMSPTMVFQEDRAERSRLARSSETNEKGKYADVLEMIRWGCIAHCRAYCYGLY